MSIQFSSIWPIEKTVSGTTTPDQDRPGVDGNEFPKAPVLLEPYYHIQDTCSGDSYTAAKMQSVDAVLGWKFQNYRFIDYKKTTWKTSKCLNSRKCQDCETVNIPLL